MTAISPVSPAASPQSVGAASTPSSSPVVPSSLAPATGAKAGEIVTVTADTLGSQRDYSPLKMLLRMPGTESVSYRSPTKDWYKLQQVNPVFAKLASSVLKDTVDGAKILFEAPGKLPEPPDAGYGSEPWWERRIHMIKTIASLPGVHDYQYVGSRAVAFHTANAEARAGLQAILRDTLPDKNNTKIFLVVSKNGPEG